jgi:amino acid transporter
VTPVDRVPAPAAAAEQGPGRTGALGRTWRVLVGPPLRFRQIGKERINPVEGLSALSLDALTSVAYGPQAIVVVLAVAGASALDLVLPITGVIVALLVILVASYRQVIDAYPSGGGAYAVSRANLGTRVSLVAAAALVVDYTLTVAVSVSAGVSALVSAFPSLAQARLGICLGILLLITVMNLRGLGETARAFLVPTLVFIVGLLVIVAVGLVHPLGLGQPQPGHPLLATRALTTVGVLLVLKAFSAGCSALTGVEAIANGVPLFKEPRAVTAKRTELLLGVILGTMLLGLGVLDRRWHVGPRSGQTVLSQIMGDAVGRHWAYYVVSLAITVSLGLAANTSFGGLPVLASLLGRDNFLPHLFTLRGDRQVFSSGILTLAALAGVLIVVFDGDTQSLIPMFAIGVFTGFTLAQAGMVVHWRRSRPRRWGIRAAFNGLGAVVTGTATVIFLVTKFTEGAWVVLVAVPAFIVLFVRVSRYYGGAARALGMGRLPARPAPGRTLVVVPITAVNRLASAGLSDALSMGSEVLAVTVIPEDEGASAREAALRADWERWDPGVPLRVLRTEYASVARPIAGLVDELCDTFDGHVVVLLPVVRPRRRRYALLHNHVDRVVADLLKRRGDIIVTRVPIELEPPEAPAGRAPSANPATPGQPDGPAAP